MAFKISLASTIRSFGSLLSAIDITIVEGTPDYTFEWIHGAITDDINELYAGTYRLKVTDGNGCESFASYEVLEPELIQAELMVDEPIFQDELSKHMTNVHHEFIALTVELVNKTVLSFSPFPPITSADKSSKSKSSISSPHNSDTLNPVSSMIVTMGEAKQSSD